MGRFRETPEQLKARRDEAMSGTGRVRYVNNTKGDLILPKERLDKSVRRGVPKNVLGKGEEFIGDSYFMYMTQGRNPDLRVLEHIKEEIVADKLITEQPPIVTQGGQVEYVREEAPKPAAPKAGDDVLLTEDPLDGVRVVLG